MRTLKEKSKAIIFDMDGVIVDSMPYHYLAWYEALRPYGVRVSCFEVYRREGERWDRSLKDFLRMGNLKPTAGLMKKVFAARQKIFKKYFKRFIFKGVEDFLTCLKGKGYRLGLVTGTPHAQVVRILPASIRNLFECVVAGDQVRNGKPHPEPYLKAVGLLNLAVHECVVVENAPYGIESAKRAGMFCIAVTTSLPAVYLSKADCIVDRLEEIPAFVEKLCHGKMKK
ncbi:MAG: HAD family phosphatase [Candidatus Omnitrophota bacterium]